MTNPINLKEIERKAVRSTYQDGLLDIYLGLVVVFMSVFVFRPSSGYSPQNLLLMLAAFCVSYALYWAGKKFITLPRMGQVRFGAIRKQKNATLGLILGLVILIQVGIVGLTAAGRLIPTLGEQVAAFFGARNVEILLVAAIGSLFVGPSMLLMAYFTDYPHGYYIAVLMSVAVFVMIYRNQPLYPVLIGGLIVVVGLVSLASFLRKYPLTDKNVAHG
jgi:hypothetical protein